MLRFIVHNCATALVLYGVTMGALNALRVFQ
jgi:hypothetical protein